MRDNNNYKPDNSCAFGEMLIAVLYHEATAQEIADFESHLKHCGECGDELAAFGTLRSAVSEWREIEFAPLDLPPIVLPGEVRKTETNPAAKNSWLESVRAFFKPDNFGWQIAAAGFGVFVILGLFFIIFTDFSQPNNQFAKSANASANPTPEIASVTEKELAIRENPVSQTPPETFSAPAGEKFSSNSTRIKRKAQRQIVNSAARGGNLRKRTIQAQKIGRTDEELSFLPVADPEDNSPRLTDLFEEVEEPSS